LRRYMSDPAASGCTDHNLRRALKKFKDNGRMMVEEMPEGSLFDLDGKTFKKGRLLRKNYECIEILSHRRFFVSAVAEGRLLAMENKSV